MNFEIREDENEKKVVSENFNSIFNKKTGNFLRWGSVESENPIYSPFGPEIADIEITTICKGPGGVLCPYCYKGNTKNGENMTFDTFKNIFHKLPRTIQQVAFGADADLSSNPDIWRIMDYCRNNYYQEVIPNITVADVSDDVAQKLSEVCGAVAVSMHHDKDLCYNSVKKLTDLDMEQVNIHYVIHEGAFDNILETIRDIKYDPRLKYLNAIVFLSLKQKGRGEKFQRLSDDKFKFIIELCMYLGIRFGFESCGCHKFLNAIKDSPNYKELEEMSESCESTLFSTYIDVHGKFFPCSFTPNTEGWEDGIDVTKVDDFLKDIWYNEKTNRFRDNLIHCNRNCPIYNV